MLWLKVVFLFIAGLLNFLVALLVLLRGPHRLSNISFFALATSIAGWTVGIAFFLLTSRLDQAFWWAKVYYLFPLLIGVSAVTFAQAWPDRRKLQYIWFIPVFVGFCCLAVPLFAVHDFITASLVFHSWGKEIVLNRFEYLFYSIFILLCYPLSLFQIYRKSRREQRLYAAQARLFSLGYLVALVFGLIFNLILPWLGNYQLIWAGPIFTTAFIIAVAYSIIRHKMFDIRLVVSRLLAYLLAISLLLGGYTLVSYVGINAVLSYLDGNFKTAVNFIFIAIAAATYTPLLRYFNRVTNRIFYHDAYDPQTFIDEVNQALVTNFELDKLLDAVSQIVVENLKAEYCVFGIKETKFYGQRVIGTVKKTFKEADVNYVRSITPYLTEQVVIADYLTPKQHVLKKMLDQNDIAALVRIAPATNIPQEGIGYMLLGRKKSGDLYNDQDTKMLGIFAKELLIAIQNALHFDEIKQFNVTLQEEVDSATSKLRRTNKRLQELDNIKDDFISMASHQLRTPLTSVKGYLSMVLEGDAGKLNPTQKQMLKQAFTSSQRMVFLITDLLNVSRLKTGKFVVDAAPTDLNEVIEQELAQLQEAAEIKNIELSFTKLPHALSLMLDEVKIRQVIMNFVDNAIYYTQQGGHIRVEITDRPSTVELRVVDDGIGVPRSEQHHLFTKFYRATNARKARPDGTGLGLFMAAKVIMAQGGSIIFNSQENKGSTFGFTLPKAALKVPANGATHADSTLLGAKLPHEERKASARLANIR